MSIVARLWRRPRLSGVLLGCCLGLLLWAGGVSLARAAGQWLAGDFHTHTFLTDGSHTQVEVAHQALSRFGLDWLANSEHGGQSKRDPYGNTLAQPLWRWFTLQHYSFPLIQILRTRYPNKLLIQGLEWNVPGHGHASVGLIADEPRAVAAFEYQFDAADQDVSRAGEGLDKQNATHADALVAVRWLNKRYPRQSYVIINHPSRSWKYRAADLRDLHNAAPEVVLGLEGLPGHQKKVRRGGYDKDLGADTPKSRTYGGADYMAARVGGLWDALLAEGRRFFIFASSDFHVTRNDFWPGEYSRTYVYVQDRTYPGLLQGLRSGRVFVVHGDLIQALDFQAESRGRTAAMGETLVTGRGDPVRLTIRFQSSGRNACGDPVQVDHVDLISGEITGLALPGTPAYQQDTNPTTRIVARFTPVHWQTMDGWQVMEYRTPPLDRARYFRLRGTNLAPGVGNETDQEGNPLMDEMAGLNTAAKACGDLWFYSNPIFIQVRD